MSYKQQEIDKLIQEVMEDVLTEKNVNLDDFFKTLQGRDASTYPDTDTAKPVFEPIATLQPPPNVISIKDLQQALALDNGKWKEDFEKVIRPSLYTLADMATKDNDPEAIELIKQLYYNLKPTSQIAAIDKTVKQIISQAAADAGHDPGQTTQAVESELKLTAWSPPSFVTRNKTASDQSIDKTIQGNKQLGTLETIPTIKVDENWGTEAGENAVPLIFKNARQVIGSGVSKPEDRIKAIAEYFAAIFTDPSTLVPTATENKDKLSEMLNKIMLMQSIAYLTTATTGDTGGWLFESMVAALTDAGQKLGGNNEIEDVVMWDTNVPADPAKPGHKGGIVTGYSLKFKTGDNITSAMSNMIRYFFSGAEIAAAPAGTKIPGSKMAMTKSSAIGKKALGQTVKDKSGKPKLKPGAITTAKPDTTTKYGGIPDELVLIFGSRDQGQYTEVQFYKIVITKAEAQNFIGKMASEGGKEELAGQFKGRIDFTKSDDTIMNNWLKSQGKVPLGPKITLDQAKMAKYKAEANKILEGLSLDLGAINTSFNQFKILTLSYFQTWDLALALESKTQFETFRSKINETYQEYDTGVKLENKKKLLDKLIEEVILESMMEDK